MQFLTEIIRLLTVMVPHQRQRDRIHPLHEPRAEYVTDAEQDLPAALCDAPLP